MCVLARARRTDSEREAVRGEGSLSVTEGGRPRATGHRPQATGRHLRLVWSYSDRAITPGRRAVESTPRKARWGQQRSRSERVAGKASDGAAVTVGRTTWAMGSGQAASPCLCMSCAHSNQGVCRRCVLVPQLGSKRRHKGGGSRELQPPRWPPPGAGEGFLLGWPSPTSACRCPGELCSWGSSDPRPGGRPRRRG